MKHTRLERYSCQFQKTSGATISSMTKMISFIFTWDYPNKRINNMMPAKNGLAFRKHQDWCFCMENKIFHLVMKTLLLLLWIEAQEKCFYQFISLVYFCTKLICIFCLNMLFSNRNNWNYNKWKLLLAFTSSCFLRNISKKSF